jgi:branched-chain amino acid transport system ATP-binding protein
MSGAPLLAVRGLTKRFGGLAALDGVDLDVPERAIVSIIGPNGSGKTTFFNCVSGVYEPTAGSIRLGDREIGGLPPGEVTAAGVSRTFQTIRLFPEMTVLENVLVGLQGRQPVGLAATLLRTGPFVAREREAEARATELLGFFGDALLPRAGDLAKNLSYANQRRLEIVRAKATGGRLLLLDEPAAGMNPKETDGLMHDIVRLRGDGRTILLIEHDMAVIAAISDHVVALDHGQKIAEGSFAEVRAHPHVIEAYLGRGAAGAAGDHAVRA